MCVQLFFKHEQTDQEDVLCFVQVINCVCLTRQDPQPEDSGLYKCNIKNEFGEINANLTLNIESMTYYHLFSN